MGMLMMRWSDRIHNVSTTALLLLLLLLLMGGPFHTTDAFVTPTNHRLGVPWQQDHCGHQTVLSSDTALWLLSRPHLHNNNKNNIRELSWQQSWQQQQRSDHSITIDHQRHFRVAVASSNAAEDFASFRNHNSNSNDGNGMPPYPMQQQQKQQQHVVMPQVNGFFQQAQHQQQHQQTPPSYHNQTTADFVIKNFEQDVDENENDDNVDNDVSHDPPRAATSSKSGRTLYEILGASPTDTRGQLKQRYIALARQSHPDALIAAAKQRGVTNVTTTIDFHEVAAAWRVLSDAKQRKRYDRALQAEQWTEEFATWAAETAIPAAAWSVQVLEQVAMPFLRRTTATTWASVQAAIAGGGKLRSNPIRSVVNAARQASKAVDRYELLAKAQELEHRAVQEYKQAVALQKELQRVAKQRLKLALHTAHSGLTSAEALVVLQQEQQSATATMETPIPLSSSFEPGSTPAAAVMMQAFDPPPSAPEPRRHQAQQPVSRGRFSFFNPGNNNNNRSDSNGGDSSNNQNKRARNMGLVESDEIRVDPSSAIQDEIAALERVEDDFCEIQTADSQAQDVYRIKVRERLLARTALLRAEQELDDARRSFDQAQRNFVERKRELEILTHELAQAEAVAKKSSYEVEIRTMAIEEQSERVRHTLRHREQQQLLNVNSGYVDTTAHDEENTERLQRLGDLRKQEQILAEQSSQMEVRAARLLSRANKLKLRAEEVKRARTVESASAAVAPLRAAEVQPMSDQQQHDQQGYSNNNNVGQPPYQHYQRNNNGWSESQT